MGYLDAYGAGVDRRLKLIKYGILAGVVLLVVAAILYLQFRDYPEHQVAVRFLERVQAGDLRGAYAMWGCSDAEPCRDYRFEKFVEDWGPSSPYGRVQDARIAATHSCDSGIIEVLRYPNQPGVNLWVDRRTDIVSFAPWQLKEIPNDARSRFAAWMWALTRNCRPLIGP